MPLTTVSPGVGGTGLTAPGANGNVLTSNGTAWVSSAPAASGGFDAGTVMIFAQTSAPTGWTKLTNLNDYALRVVSGAASTGGSVAFTTAFAASRTSDATTLSTSQIPSHSHVQRYTNAGGGGSGMQAANCGNSGAGDASSLSTNATGGGGSHTHGLPSFAVQYVDVIRASKD